MNKRDPDAEFKTLHDEDIKLILEIHADYKELKERAATLERQARKLRKQAKEIAPVQLADKFGLSRFTVYKVIDKMRLKKP